MDVKIITLEETYLLGLSIETTLSESKTVALWKSFMPIIQSVDDRIGENFYSVQIYPNHQTMEDFTPITAFTKWSAIAVSNNTTNHPTLKSLTLPKGLYAQFVHKGKASDFFRTSQYIFGTWLPSSQYTLDNRPHFEIMPPNYKGPNDPKSEELVYIPIK